MDTSQDEEERAAKRRYLTSEIIDQDYSPELFTQYCDGLKGDDIDVWDIEELRECVRDFKMKFRCGQEEEDQDPSSPTTQAPVDAEPVDAEPVDAEPVDAEPLKMIVDKVLPAIVVVGELPSQHDPEEEPNAETVEEAKGKNENPEEYKAPPSPLPRPSAPLPVTIPRSDSGFYLPRLSLESVHSDSYSVPATPLPATQLSMDLSAKTTILHFAVEAGGLLSSSYVNYYLLTTPFGWRVTRKETDFTSLRTALQTAYPGFYVCDRQVPPNPPKKTMNKFEPETLRKRTKFLQEFIDSILRCDAFKRSPEVIGFLKDSEKQFEVPKKVRARQQTSKVKKPMKIEDIPFPSGSLMCNPTTSQAYSVRLYSFLTASSQLKKKLKRQTELLTQSFRALSVQLGSFAELMRELTVLQDELPEASRHKEIYGELVMGLETWGKHEIEVAEEVGEAFGTFFKYRYNEMAAFKEMIKERECYLNAYLKADKMLSSKKEQLWQKGDIMKWDMLPEDLTLGASRLKSDKELAFSKMLSTETVQVQKARDLYGFYNFQLHSEVERILADTSELESVHFNSFAQLHAQLIGRVTAQWKKMYEKTKHLAVTQLADGARME